MTQSTSEQGRRRWALLGNGNFILLWCAYGVSAMGDHLAEMAILKTQNVVSADVDVTPLDARMTFLFFVPFLLLAPLTGLMADRLPRRGLMIVADLARCLVLFLFATLMAFSEPWGSWGKFLPLLLVGAFATLFSPARSALLPTLIRRDQLIRANGLIAGLGVIATMFALLLGGYLADHDYAPRFVFRIDAVTFLGSAVLLMMLRAPHRASRTGVSPGASGFLRNLAAGFRYARCHRRVLELLLVGALVWFCGALVKCVMPAVVRDVYGGSYQDIGLFRAFLGIGFILGAAVISTLSGALRSEIAITWGLFGIAGSIALFAASAFLPLPGAMLYAIGAVGVVGAGLFGVWVMASFNALLQRIVPDRFRGRVFGVKDVVCTAALLCATGLLGIPAWAHIDRWAGYILLAVAAITAVACCVTFRIRQSRSEFTVLLTAAANLNEFIAKSWWRLRRIGRSTVPHDGPVIVTANHRCSIDPMLLSAAVRCRRLAFMVAAEYTNWPIAGQLMRLVDCIPVRREMHDTAATKQALRHLRQGRALGVFIEGRIVPPGEEPEPKDGVALLALRTGAVVIPAYISGTVFRANLVKGLFVRHNARVRFGPPVDLDEFRAGKPDRTAIRAATLKVFAAIAALAEPDNDRLHAGADHDAPLERQETEYGTAN